MEIVFTTWDIVEAGFIQSLLESNGISCRIRNQHYATLTLTGSGAAPIAVAVKEEDRAAADEIVQQYYRDLNNGQ